MSIQKVIESVEKQHGGDRDQAAKHRAYLDFLRQLKLEQARER
jgi:hypothetical protein